MPKEDRVSNSKLSTLFRKLSIILWLRSSDIKSRYGYYYIVSPWPCMNEHQTIFKEELVDYQKRLEKSFCYRVFLEKTKLTIDNFQDIPLNFQEKTVREFQEHLFNFLLNFWIVQKRQLAIGNFQETNFRVFFFGISRKRLFGLSGIFRKKV